MNSRSHLDINARIIDKAKAFGASLAGIASVAPLRNSPAYEIYDKAPYHDGYRYHIMQKFKSADDKS